MRSAWSGARPPEQSVALPQVDAGTTVVPEPWAVVPPARVSPGAAGNDGRVISLLRRPGTAPSQIPAPATQGWHISIFYRALARPAIGLKGPWRPPRLMAARKPSGRKIRLHKKTLQTTPVPTWILLRTKRRVRTNPKRRAWRQTDVEVG